MDTVHGIETKSVDVELIDPVTGIGDEELADRTAVGPVEVESLAPFILVARGEVVVFRVGREGDFFGEEGRAAPVLLVQHFHLHRAVALVLGIEQLHVIAQ